MSETVAEFMQKPVKKYACGKRVEQAKKTLMNAFTASSKRKAAEEKTIFEKIIDIVNKTPTGRETLKNLSKTGCTFHLEALSGNLGGFFNPDKNKLVVNRNMDLDGMASLLVHEGTHACQWSLRTEKDSTWYYAVDSHYRDVRGQEADACAHQTAFHYECKTAHPSLYQDFKQNPLYAPLLNAYEGEMEKSGDSGKAMQKTFAAWYENVDMMNIYDGYIKGDIKNTCDRFGKDYSGLFSKERPSENIVRKFRHHGKQYISADFLNKGKAFSIKPRDKQEIYATMIDYARVSKGKADLSVLKMNDRTEDGKLIPPRNKTAKTVQAAAVAKAKRQGR